MIVSNANFAVIVNFDLDASKKKALGDLWLITSRHFPPLPEPRSADPVGSSLETVEHEETFTVNGTRATQKTSFPALVACFGNVSTATQFYSHLTNAMGSYKGLMRESRPNIVSIKAP